MSWLDYFLPESAVMVPVRFIAPATRQPAYLMLLVAVVFVIGCQNPETDLLRHAQANLDQQDFDRALEFANEAVRQAPKSSAALIVRAKIHAERRDFPKVIADLQRARELSEDFSESELLADAHFREQNYEAAEAAATDAIAQPSHTASAWLLRGKARLAQENAQGALQDFEQALRLETKQAEARLYCGIAELQRQEFAEAEEQFTRVIEGGKSSALAFWLRGAARKELGDEAGAESDQSIAKEIDPSLDFGQFTVGENLIQSILGREGVGSGLQTLRSR
jgi:tetratricopeptide (TPR) repeat protein